MKTKTLIAFTILLLGAALASHAQTNTPSPIAVNNAQEALGAFIHYEFPNVSIENGIVFAGGLMGLLMAGARYLRKIIPDNLQANKIGLALAHVAGEVNPSVEKLALAAKTPQLLPPPVTAPAAAQAPKPPAV